MQRDNTGFLFWLLLLVALIYVFSNAMGIFSNVIYGFLFSIVLLVLIGLSYYESRTCFKMVQRRTNYLRDKLGNDDGMSDDMKKFDKRLKVIENNKLLKSWKG